MPHVVYFALGGTISMTGGPDGGAVSTLTGAQLIDRLPEVPGDVRVHDVLTVAGGSLSFANVLEVADAAAEVVRDGAGGIVLTQGTDTIEETAFLIDSVWQHEVPFVVSGAMRNPTQAGADGPANLLAALQIAAAPTARGRGVLVALADEIHAARHVCKTHSTGPGTFVSDNLGPIGYLVEGVPRFLADLPRRSPVAGWSRKRLAATKIALYVVTLDDDGMLLAGLDHCHHGLVVAGYGAGHVPAGLVPALIKINDVMPVVITSRTGASTVLTHTYGGPGSERDLLGRGVISGGFVHPYKARVLLRLLVATGATRDQIAAAFASLG